MARGSARKEVRTDGTVVWYPRWDEGINPATGKRMQREGAGVWFATRAEAVDYAEDQLYAMRHGTYVRPTGETVGSYLTRWLEGKALVGKVKDHTIFGYERALTLRLKRMWHLPLTELTAARLHAVYLAERKRGVGPGSIRNCHSPLKQALDQAVRYGELPRNVARDVEIAPYEPEARAIWTVDEARCFIRHVQGAADGAIWVVALAASLRIGELLALRWADVDLTRGRLVVRQTVTKDRLGKITEGTTKNKRVRTIHLPAPVVAVLRAHKDRLAFARERLGPLWVDEDRVFPAADGRRWSQQAAGAAFHAAREAAGVRRTVPHGARHYGGTRMMLEKVPAAVVKEWLGHSKVSITIDLYGHPDEQSHRDAAAVLWASLDPAGGEFVGNGADDGQHMSTQATIEEHG